MGIFDEVIFERELLDRGILLKEEAAPRGDQNLTSPEVPNETPPAPAADKSHGATGLPTTPSFVLQPTSTFKTRRGGSHDANTVSLFRNLQSVHGSSATTKTRAREAKGTPNHLAPKQPRTSNRRMRRTTPKVDSAEEAQAATSPRAKDGLQKTDGAKAEERGTASRADPRPGSASRDTVYSCIETTFPGDPPCPPFLGSPPAVSSPQPEVALLTPPPSPAAVPPNKKRRAPGRAAGRWSLWTP
ncbi:hypothetical protein BJ875DRAFT_440435 [Amylocarpus encephaloides]|uniref:Uncharacterized protein n=1 Tax=Amylocarpus encephaloides TaxID=45428 RepID=A0A9P7YKK3_9HELO|nr:hypothetical protein BJ875DRAFT_440435 [Amylocarpus encephaloides]